MPIIDYEAAAKQSKANLFSNPKISKENKEAVNEFLIGWKVTKGDRKSLPISSARENIFFKQIIPLLESTDNIREDMNNREKINIIFDKLSKKLTHCYYGTVINVSLTMVTKLNDGVKPKGFKDIKNISKKSQKKDISDEDMITWEEGKKITQVTNSVQLKAAIMTQLDGGFRPSEFTDLNYGDISIKKNFIIASVRNGKTGKRDVILFKAVPYLQRWLSMHPTKKKDDSLWMVENPNKSHRKIKSHSKKYPYFALKKRIKYFADKAGINKPMDFYNLRHSAVTISKLDNVNPGLAAEKFGHSIEYYENTYGRLNQKDKINRFKKAYNLDETEKEKKQETTIVCEMCGTVNVPGAKICEKCGRPLTLDKAMESYNELKDLKKQMQEMNKVLEAIRKDKKIA